MTREPLVSRYWPSTTTRSPADSPFVTAAGAFVFYVCARRWAFPTAIPPELSIEAFANKPLAARMFGAILRWYAQPVLPKDPLNNPLVTTDMAHRIGGALRVWFRGLPKLPP